MKKLLIVMNKQIIPTTKLLKNLAILSKQPSPHKKPIVLFQPGTLNPVHKKHVLNLEYAKKLIEEQEPDKKVVGGYLHLHLPEDSLLEKLSKDKIVKDVHRIKMVELAAEDSDWIEFNKLSIEVEQRFPEIWVIDVTPFGQLLSNYFNKKFFTKKISREISQYGLGDIEVITVFGTDAAIKFVEHFRRFFDQGFRLVVVKRENEENWQEPVIEAFDKHLGRERWEKKFYSLIAVLKYQKVAVQSEN